MKKNISVGLFYNLRNDYQTKPTDPIDIQVEWDVFDEIKEVHNYIKQSGFKVLDIGDPKMLFKKKIRHSIDIVFSLCEMQGFRFRESLVPSICEILGLPYVFSTPDAMMISLDKNICNYIVRQAGCPVSDWYIIKPKEEITKSNFYDFPYIVKPVAEGSSMGINEKSVVFNYSELLSQVKWIVEQYRQPAIVQKFMEGREFTVGIIEENNNIIALDPLEVIYINNYNDSLILGLNIKENENDYVKFVTLHASEAELKRKIQDLACKAFKAINCRDAARVDIRLSKNNIPNFLEINLLPAMSDFCKSFALASAMKPEEIMGKIIKSALDRYGINY